MFGEALKLKLSGIDFNGSDELHPAANPLNNVLPVCPSSGKQNHIHLAADISGLRCDVLGDVQHKSLHPDLRADVPLLPSSDNLPKVISPEKRHGTSVSHQFLLDLSL